MNYFRKYKLAVLVLSILLLAILIVVVFLNSQPQRLTSAASLIKTSEEKASSLNFMVEYEEVFYRALDGNAQEYKYRVVKTKNGAQARKDTYMNNAALSESFIRNEHGIFYCTPYGVIPCRKLGDSSKSLYHTTDTIREKLEGRGIFVGTVTPRIILIGEIERPALCARYIFNPALIPDADLEDLLGGDSAVPGGVAEALQSRIQHYESEACFDNETGIALASGVKVRQTLFTPSGNIEYISEDRITTTQLQMNPQISPKIFTGADLKEK